MAKAIVFDLDGTLVDSAADLHVAINKLLAEEGRRALTLDEVIGMIGDGAAKLVQRAFHAAGGAQEEDALQPRTARFLSFYEGHATDSTRPYPEAPAVLAALRDENWSLGVCTNKPERAACEVLRDLDLARFFDAVVGGDSLEGVKKPDPRLLLAVLQRLGASSAEAVMVGDNANDVQVARAAGVPVIIRAGGYTRVPAVSLGADVIIQTFAELPAAIAQVIDRPLSTRG